MTQNQRNILTTLIAMPQCIATNLEIGRCPDVIRISINDIRYQITYLGQFFVETVKDGILSSGETAQEFQTKLRKYDQ